MEYLGLLGEPALTAAAARKYDAISYWMHYIHLKNPNAGEKVEKLKQLLLGSEGETLKFIIAELDTFYRAFYAALRNISLWSSKAMSIAYVRGLKNKVRRIERGCVIFVKYPEPFEGTIYRSKMQSMTV